MISLDFLNNNYEDNRTPEEKAFESIAIDILRGNLINGSRLSEDFLCEKYAMGRTPMRAVLQKLNSLGVIKLEKNKGASVCAPSREITDDYLLMRALLLPQAARWAAERMTKDELDALAETYSFLEFYTKQGEDLDKVLRIIRGFWAIIYNGTHNRELENTLLKLDFLIRYSNEDLKYPINYLEVSFKEHSSVANAILKHQPEQAYEAASICGYNSVKRRK